jgi:hypothetical protein
LEVKVTVVVNRAGDVIAAHVPSASESGPDSAQEDSAATRIEFTPSEDQEVLYLDVPEEDVPLQPRSDLLETLQRHKDRSSH